MIGCLRCAALCSPHPAGPHSGTLSSTVRASHDHRICSFQGSKITPSLLGHGKGSTSTVFPKVFSKNFSRAKRSAKHSLREGHVVWHIPLEKSTDRKGKAKKLILVAAVSICEKPSRILPHRSCRSQSDQYPCPSRPDFHPHTPFR